MARKKASDAAGAGFALPAAMVVAKVNLKVRGDGEREARIELRCALSDEDAGGMPGFVEEGVSHLADNPGLDELRFSREHGPVNMRCRTLPPGSGALGSEQFLREVVWRKIRLVREELGIALRFRVALGLDQAVWAWLWESFGTQIWVETELAQRELPISIAAGPHAERPQ